MRRTALLIGAETFGLTGVRNDVEAMAERLERRGFGVQCNQGADATRSGILDALERLVRQAQASDAVVVYFSGHGGLVAAPPALIDRRNPVPRLQFLVPTDYDGRGDFRGITTAELSVLMSRLTARTSNVVFALDACHASNMVRGDGVRVKSLCGPGYLDVVGHLAALKIDRSLLHTLGNPDVVRLAACRRDRSAYEYTNAAGHRVGVFTEALTTELDLAADERVTWADLVHRVHTRMRMTQLDQRPEAEGPSQRLLFQAGRTAGDRPAWPSVPAQCDLNADVVIEWGHMVRGEPHPLPASGATLYADERVYVRVRNNGEATVYAALLEVDRADRAWLITAADPSGAAVLPGETYAVGHNDLTGRWSGISLERDLGGRPQTVTLAVVVSSAPRDRAPNSGRFREISSASRPTLSDVHHFEILLLPARSRPDL